MTYSLYIADSDPLANILKSMPARARSQMVRRALMREMAGEDSGLREIIHKLLDGQDELKSLILSGNVAGNGNRTDREDPMEAQQECGNLATPEIWASVLGDLMGEEK